MNQSSSKKMKRKTSSFLTKLLKKMSCFHLPSDTAVSEEDVSDHHEQQQQQPPRQPPQQLVNYHGGVGVNVGSMKQPRQPPQQLVICYGGLGVDVGSMKSVEVPMNYVSSSITLRALLEQSGVELKTTLSRGWAVIWCDFAEVESALKLAEAIAKAKEREKKSSSSLKKNSNTNRSST